MHRTSHGSTLSRIVHSWVLSRSDRSHAWKFFIQALESDVADVQGGTTQEGIHLGAMSGTVDVLQRAYTGIDFLHGRLCVNPCLPEELQRLRLRMRFRKHLLMIEINHEKLSVESLKSHAGPIEISIGNRFEVIDAGGKREFPLVEGRLEAG
jgi:alpha,alpha-trehalase